MENTASRQINLIQKAESSYMSLPASCLAIGETCCHATFENGLHQRFGCEPGKKKTSVMKWTL